MGPLYLQFYHKEKHGQYIGRVLVSVGCEYVNDKIIQNITSVPIPPLHEDNYWPTQTFTIHFVLLGLICMPIHADKINIHLSCGGKKLLALTYL